MKITSAREGCILHYQWRRSGDSHDEPHQGRECEAAERAELKPECVRRTEVMDDGEGEDEDNRGNRSQGDERHVYGAMKFLPGKAVDTLGEVSLVVAAHLRREASDVIAPSCEDVADEWIDALTHIYL